MRDLSKYPVTPAEIVECLLRLSAEFAVNEGDEGGAGSMDPLLLATAAAIVTAANGVLLGIEARFSGTLRDQLRYVTPWKEAAELELAFQVLKEPPP